MIKQSDNDKITTPDGVPAITPLYAQTADCIIPPINTPTPPVKLRRGRPQVYDFTALPFAVYNAGKIKGIYSCAKRRGVKVQIRQEVQIQREIIDPGTIQTSKRWIVERVVV
jgi:hypothetical protein